MNKCPKCGIQFRPEEKALWCAFVPSCPNTDQKKPTEEQEIQLGMREEK